MRTLFRRGTRYALGVVGLDASDVVLASFPKSGSTWVRFFICNLLALDGRLARPVDFRTVDTHMPELGVSNLFDAWPHEGIPRFVKTHLRWSPIFRRNRAVLVVRDPYDVMVSYYRYELGKQNRRFEGSFSEFIRHKKLGLHAYLAHFESWRDRHDVLVRYEQLHASDTATFRRMLSGLGVEISEAMLQEAVEASRFDRLKRVESSHGHLDARKFRDDFAFVGRGQVGYGRECFNPEDRAYVAAMIDEFDYPLYS